MQVDKFTTATPITLETGEVVSWDELQARYAAKILEGEEKPKIYCHNPLWHEKGSMKAVVQQGALWSFNDTCKLIPSDVVVLDPPQALWDYRKLEDKENASIEQLILSQADKDFWNNGRFCKPEKFKNYLEKTFEDKLTPQPPKQGGIAGAERDAFLWAYLQEVIGVSELVEMFGLDEIPQNAA